MSVPSKNEGANFRSARPTAMPAGREAQMNPFRGTGAPMDPFMRRLNANHTGAPVDPFMMKTGAAVDPFMMKSTGDPFAQASRVRSTASRAETMDPFIAHLRSTAANADPFLPRTTGAAMDPADPFVGRASPSFRSMRATGAQFDPFAPNASVGGGMSTRSVVGGGDPYLSTRPNHTGAMANPFLRSSSRF